NKGGPVFTFLPGSRQSEVRNLADTYIATAAVLHERHPDARFLVPLATRETRLLFEEALRRHAHVDVPIRILFGHAVEAMTAADVVLVASGTASLEAALLKRPMVITYMMGKWSFRLMRRMAYLPWVGLPNVLAGREVVPELLQDAATPQALADALDGWLTDKARTDELTQIFTDMHLQLRQDTAAKAAAAILPYLRGRDL
ncbi:MAG: lipid-A-disaccharide synthase, partial [Zoogloea oleivorans]|nr:lipid-A-disaccharide synthase [Zoogloea oleivorans]